MKLLFILFGVIYLAHSLPDTTKTAQHFCDMSYLCPRGKKSIACSYTSNLSMGCNGKMIPLDKDWILSLHNDYRQKIAAGEYAPGYKSAVDMQEMQWSDELEMIASYNARGCYFGHDACRSTDNFKLAGQNIATASITGAPITDPKKHIKDLIDGWFSEYKDTDMRTINAFYLYSTSADIGHFTQMVKSTANRVGCSASNYMENEWDNLYIVCNYAVTNVNYEPTYIAGPPGAGYSTDLAKDFCGMSGLCKPGTQSVACSFTSNLSMGCDGEMVPIDKNLILSVHNEYRQKIANGEFAPQYEGATNMAEMKYSEELEIMASYNARSCVFAHDDCRKTNNFPYAGQNIANVKKFNSDIDLKADITKMMNSWFDEYTDCDMSVIVSYHKIGYIGHFTQMVKDNATEVGCAASNYMEDDWEVLYLVCNYAYTNMLDQPIYVAGSPGADCQKKSGKYPALCAS
ncbi:uncharacterized protein LOC129619333 [Condylostylus longicornis]|uniref:uncharacterized protein LOC129619333 n=1 Tax=Condylostylus longicornis TaxID=2530218 RepID=UPI00244E5250|nr:uncharacterized protein LOC129619333 [Condylostylus longicornis]